MSDVEVWLDPGKTTGAAGYDDDTETFFSGQYQKEELYRHLVELSQLYGGRLAVGVEHYIITSGGARRGTPKYSREVITVVEQMASEGYFRMLPPMPSSARMLGSIVFLRRLGWYRPGERHANDAGQHLLSSILRTRPMLPNIRRKLFPGYGADVTIAT